MCYLLHVYTSVCVFFSLCGLRTGARASVHRDYTDLSLTESAVSVLDCISILGPSEPSKCVSWDV